MLAKVSIGLMQSVVEPLGGLVTRLPVGPEYPGSTAGRRLVCFTRPTNCFPTGTAWAVLEERKRVLAELGTKCQEACAPLYMPIVAWITGSLEELADQLADAH